MKFVSLLGGGQIVSSGGTWGEDLWKGLSPVLVAVFALVGVASVGYAIYLGFLLAKAADDGKRKQAKSRIFKTLSGLFIIVILISAMTIPGPSGETLIGSFLTGTTDRVAYRLSQINFSIAEVSGGNSKQLVLYKNGQATSDGVEFVQVASNGVNITGRGVITASAAGDAVIEVKVGDKIVLDETYIIVRAIGEAPPPSSDQVMNGGVDAGVPEPSAPGGGDGGTIPPPQPNDGTRLGSLRALAEQYLGWSGYAQVKSTGGTSDIPNRNTASYVSHYYENGQKINRTIRYFDCSSFTNYIYSNIVGINITGTVSTQYNYMKQQGYVVSVPQPGDWFCYENTSHTGIYLGNIGSVQRFGSFGGTTYDNGNIYIHCSGGTGSGFGWFWSNYKGDTYRQGVVYGQMTKSGSNYYVGSNKIIFARPFIYV